MPLKDKSIKGRVGKNDWLRTGLALLSNEGPQALRIDRLCAAIGKTRGSFYHHFEDRQTFYEQMLEFWRAEHTDQIIAQVEEAGEVLDRRQLLNELAMQLDQRTETAVRQLAATDKFARKVVAEVDEARVNYLVQLLKQERGLSQQAAEDLARLDYAVFIGYQFLYPDAPESELARIGQLLERLTK
jgi:AcrR family transcriptional regulator